MNAIELKEKSEEKKQIEKRIKKAEIELDQQKAKFNQLSELLKKEHRDVEKLEKGGLTSMFYSFLGNKIEKLEQERQEYFSAKLKFDNCKKEIEDLEFEIVKLTKQVVDLGSPENEYNELLLSTKNKLQESGDSSFLKYEELLGIYFSQKKEISEAIAAGEKALQSLQIATHYLQKAKNWGTFDMLGGGLLATAVKHSNIDEAKQMIQTVQIWLRRFKRELDDLKNSDFQEMNIQIDSFATFADYFFDNLIFDWVVQSKINRSLEACRNVHSQVAQILSKLKISDQNVTQKYHSTKTDFNTYIENQISPKL